MLSYKKIPKQSVTNKVYRKANSDIRDEYFNYHLKEIVGSEQSYVAITFPTRANICHIFDKGRHPSVQGNIANYVYLTLDEHTRFDQLLYQHEFRKLEGEFNSAWSKAVMRIKLVLPHVVENTKFKSKIEEYLKLLENES
jgi:hypothetical protein